MRLYTTSCNSIGILFRIPLTKINIQQTVAILLLPFFCLFCSSVELLAMNNGRESPKNPCVYSGGGEGGGDDIHNEGSGGDDSPLPYQQRGVDNRCPITSQPQSSGFGSSYRGIQMESSSVSVPIPQKRELCPPCNSNSCGHCIKGTCIGAGLSTGVSMITVGAITGCPCPAVGILGAGVGLAGAVAGGASSAAISLCKKHGCKKNSPYIMCDKDMCRVVGLAATAGSLGGTGVGLLTGVANGCPCPDTAVAASIGSAVGCLECAGLAACLYGISELCSQQQRTRENISHHPSSRLAHHQLNTSTPHLPITTQPQPQPQLQQEVEPEGNYADLVCGQDPCEHCIGWSTLCGANIGSGLGLGVGACIGADNLSSLGSFAATGGLCLGGLLGILLYYKKHSEEFVQKYGSSEQAKAAKEELKTFCISLCEKIALGSAIGTGVGCVTGTCVGGCMSNWECTEVALGSAAGSGAGCSVGGCLGAMWSFSEGQPAGEHACSCGKKEDIESGGDNTPPITNQPRYIGGQRLSEEDKQWCKEVLTGALGSGGCNCATGAVGSALTHGCTSSVATAATVSGATGCATGAAVAICIHCMKKHCPNRYKKMQETCSAVIPCLDSNPPITTQPQRKGPKECEGDETPGPSSGGRGIGLGPDDHHLLKYIDKESSDSDEEPEDESKHKTSSNGSHSSHTPSKNRYKTDSEDNNTKTENKGKGKGKGKGSKEDGKQQQQRPRLSGHIPTRHGYKCYDVTFIPGYNHGGHISSLQSMQTVLLGASDQVLYTLKLLALRAYTNISPSDDLNLTTKFTPRRHILLGPQQKIKNMPNKLSSALTSCAMFGFIDNYTTNLERRLRAGRVGIIKNIMPNVRLGLAYNRNKEATKEHSGMRFGTAGGSVKAQTTTDSLSTIVNWNTEQSGFTGHIASCYGWGKVKTNRTFTHGDSEVNSKGKPDISLGGGLFQLGYSLPLSKNFSFTPYIEYMISTVSWSSFNEKTGLLPCKISQNKEYVMEQSIGLRNQWKVTTKSQLQTWISGVSGRRKIERLNSKPLIAPIARYNAAIPTYKQRYLRTEFGLAYEANLMDNFDIGINTSIRLEKTKHIEGQQLNTYIRYTY